MNDSVGIKLIALAICAGILLFLEMEGEQVFSPLLKKIVKYMMFAGILWGGITFVLSFLAEQ